MQMLPYLSQGVTEWFEEYENGVNNILWSLQSSALNPGKHQWEFLEAHVDPISYKDTLCWLVL